VDVQADLPPRILLGHADRIRLTSTQVSVGDLHAASIDMTLGNVELIDRKIGTIHGSMTGVRVPAATGGSPLTADSVTVDGSGSSATATLTCTSAEMKTLVVSQIAVSVALFGVAVLFLTSLQHATGIRPGLDPRKKVLARSVSPKLKMAPAAWCDQAVARLAALPGVREVSFGQDSLLVGGFYGTAQLLMPDGTYQAVAGNFVSADFLKTSGLVLKKGRWLSGKRGDYEAVVNETFAKARFCDEDPIGKTFKLLVSGDYATPVVGVVRDVKETVRSTPGMRFYVPDWV